MTEYARRRGRQLPMALRRGEVLLELKRAGLGGDYLLRRLIDEGVLQPLRLRGSKQARFATAKVMELIAESGGFTDGTDG